LPLEYGCNREQLGIGDKADADDGNLLVFLNSKTKVKSARPGKGGRRWYKDVGLGFRTPKLAIEGQYIGTLRKTRAPQTERLAPNARDGIDFSPAAEVIARRNGNVGARNSG
jgi:hypothetical protein